MDLLLKYSANVLYDGVEVYVPMPFAYILHKLIINPKRKQYKQEKDADAVGTLFDAISDDAKAQLAVIYKTDLTKKEKSTVIETCERFPAVLGKIKSFLESKS